ncbi:MAG: serine/threonine protein kinase [Pseudomonadales bacterium]|nr:serine/threonine protein kinase [Pseudomonadales bacterium]
MKLSNLFRWRKGARNDSAAEQDKVSGKQSQARPASSAAGRQAATPPKAQKVDKPGAFNTKIGGVDYRLEPFTEGGICVVMRGIPKAPGHPKLAIKLVREQWLNHAAVRRQFSNESQIVRELNHPYLPKYRARGLVENKAYYAYEFIDGVPLINLSQDKSRFPPDLVKEMARNIVCQLLVQLEHIHGGLKPVAHGDISSENILINNRQQIYLVDFGCAHFIKQAHKESYQWLAKPSFISPEQARGDAWDNRSDLYQVGILYYELLMNRRWNVGRSKRDKVLFAASNDRQSDDFLKEVVDLETSAVIAKLLDPSPRTRYQNATEVLQALGKK